ncbi:hypothetical protein P879_04578 [Paragonimus westermani]|uniref:Sushi domain-containing protein n=1 Tax=Paragonimus westermani TaxID=34504 RepID=A0A8T0DN99_9TREM|nr:hypothetical protein P879_04578 [Paragonimus westermani]
MHLWWFLIVCLLYCPFALTVPPDVPCFDDSWQYSSVTGKCYRALNGTESWEVASRKCAGVFGNQSTANVTLLQFKNQLELQAIINLLLEVGQMQVFWTAARRIVPKCDNAPGGFDPKTMNFVPTSAHPRATVKAECKPGTFMKDASSPVFQDGPQVNKTLKQNEYYCTGQRNQTVIEDPMTFETSFQYSGYNVTSCELLKCLLLPEQLEHVDNKPTADPSERFVTRLYGENISLDCSPGFVSIQDNSSKTVVVKCGQGAVQASDGLWIPEIYQACVAVTCSEVELRQMTPNHGKLASARNYQTDKVFGPQQVNEYNVFGNVITIRCNEGFLYPDRTVEKEVECGLKEDSQIEGKYYGYSGTVLPIPSQCEATTCLYESAVMKPEHHMLPNFLIKNGTSDWKNVTKHEGLPYALQAELRFYCEDGYETVEQNAYLNITCGNLGRWVPQLIGCIAKTQKIPSQSDGRFRGEKEEAKSAKQISSVMFILTFIFLGLILLLDLTTVGRDAKQLMRNLKLQKRRIQAVRQKFRKSQQQSQGNEFEVDSNSELRNRTE